MIWMNNWVFVFDVYLSIMERWKMKDGGFFLLCLIDVWMLCYCLGENVWFSVV